MDKVTKVILFIYRSNGGRNEFFVQQQPGGTRNVLSGHVGDNVADETLEQAARRETVEELGAEPISVTNLDHKEVVELKKWNKISTEWAFLIEIPNQDVRYLEGDEQGDWYPLSELQNVLTWPNHQRAVPIITQKLT